MSSTAVTIPGYVAGTWNIDPTHSEVSFTRPAHDGQQGPRQVRHLLRPPSSPPRTRPSRRSPPRSTSSSINTGNEQRDDHLRSADFFEVDTHQIMTYRSTSVTPDGDDWRVEGELTLHGVTQLGAAQARAQRLHRRPVRRHAGRLLGHRRDQPRRLRHRVQHADGRWRRRRRRQDLRSRSRSRPSSRPPDSLSIG